MPVIGYDCNGKPLHPGDRCVLISSKDQHRSADRSFEDLMRGIKTLMPETNHL